MDIKDRIKGISKYFRGMQVESTNDGAVIYVVTEFPPKWVISNDLEEKFSVKVQQGGERGQYYFFADMETGFDKLFDAVEYSIKKMEEAQERVSLLTTKINELREIFSDDSVSIEELRELTFTYNHQIPLDKAEKEANITDFLKGGKKDKGGK